MIDLQYDSHVWEKSLPKEAAIMPMSLGFYKIDNEQKQRFRDHKPKTYHLPDEEGGLFGFGKKAKPGDPVSYITPALYFVSKGWAWYVEDGKRVLRVGEGSGVHANVVYVPRHREHRFERGEGQVLVLVQGVYREYAADSIIAGLIIVGS